MFGRIIRSSAVPGVAAEDRSVIYDGTNYLVGRFGKVGSTTVLDVSTLRTLREVSSAGICLAPWTTVGDNLRYVGAVFGVLVAVTLGPGYGQPLVTANDVLALTPTDTGYLCVKSGWSFYAMTPPRGSAQLWSLTPLRTRPPIGLGTPAGIATDGLNVYVAANSSASRGYGLRRLDAVTLHETGSAALPAADPMVSMAWREPNVLAFALNGATDRLYEVESA